MSSSSVSKNVNQIRIIKSVKSNGEVKRTTVECTVHRKNL